MRAFAHRPFLAGAINHFAALPLHFISQREQEAEPNAFKKQSAQPFCDTLSKSIRRASFFEIDP
jgi:hypothetical protein